MTIKDIIKEYLIKNGYDGLCCNECCGYTLDNLMNCDYAELPNCQSGHIKKYNVECCEFVNGKCDFDGKLCITIREPE